MLARACLSIIRSECDDSQNKNRTVDLRQMRGRGYVTHMGSTTCPGHQTRRLVAPLIERWIRASFCAASLGCPRSRQLGIYWPAAGMAPAISACAAPTCYRFRRSGLFACRPPNRDVVKGIDASLKHRRHAL
jgi:hypothetical protein